MPCKDPLCASLHHADYKCESPEQCDYQVDYADGGSSLGVLLNDVFHFNMTSGARMIPRLSLGLAIFILSHSVSSLYEKAYVVMSFSQYLYSYLFSFKTELRNILQIGKRIYFFLRKRKEIQRKAHTPVVSVWKDH